MTQQPARTPRAVLASIAVGILLIGAVLSWAHPLASPTRPARWPSSTRPVGPPSPPPLRIVALGDSVTAGTNCDCTPFPALYAHALTSRHQVQTVVANYGVPGQTSTAMLEELTRTETTEPLRNADIVVITIGANNVAPMADDVLTGNCGEVGDTLACTRGALETLREHLQDAVRHIRTVRRDQPTAILLTGYWNVYEDGTVADNDYTPGGRQRSAHLTDAVNTVIEAVADDDNAVYVDLKTAFAAEPDPTPLLAADGDHPNAAGHHVIAEALLAAGSAPLQLPRQEKRHCPEITAAAEGRASTCGAPDS